MANKRYKTRLRIRYGETDRMGIVYHPNYFHYFEIGRTELMRELGLPYREIEESGVFLVVTEAGCVYKGSVSYDDEISVETWVADVRHATVRFEYEIENLRSEKKIVEGFTTLAGVNSHMKVVRLPEKLARLLRHD